MPLFFYLIIGLLLTCATLVAYAIIVREKLTSAGLREKSAEDTAAFATLSVKQKEKTAATIEAAQQILNGKHVAAQARIDASGPHDDFDTDGF